MFAVDFKTVLNGRIYPNFIDFAGVSVLEGWGWLNWRLIGPCRSYPLLKV